MGTLPSISNKSSLQCFRCLWITSIHPYWGTAHYLRAQAVKNLFFSNSSSDKGRVEVDIVEVVLSEEITTDPHQSEITCTSENAVNHGIKKPIPSFTSVAGFAHWLEDKPLYDAVVIDRREPPSTLIEMLFEFGIPLIGFDLKAHLPVQSQSLSQRLSESYTKALAKLDYVVNAIPGLERKWANLNESEYLLSPFFLQSQKFISKDKVLKERKIYFYLGQINDSTYLKSTLIAIVRFLVLYREELAELINTKHNGEFVQAVYVSVPSLQVAPITNRVEELQCDNTELQGTTFIVEPVKELVDLTETTKPGIHDEVGVLFTHFGVYGLECLSAGIPVFFSHPSIYHQELVRRHFQKLELSQVIWDSHNPSLFDRFTPIINGYGSQVQTVCEIIKKLCLPASKAKGQVKKICKLCGGITQIVHRRQWMNLARCPSCKSVRLVELFNMSERVEWGWEGVEDYDANYFIEEYEESYGKTYRDDEVAIKAMARARLQCIQSYSGGGDPNANANRDKPMLLDIGCAYGFFLDEASKQGYATYGVDISYHAGEEVADTHKFKCGNFLKDKLEFEHTQYPLVFDVVTMWYVIEHFEDLPAVVARVGDLLKPEGIFAFSTPNADGLSARYSPETFFQSSPKDHYYIFSLSGISKYLAQHGYELMGFKATGIHYNRFRKLFPLLSKIIPKVIYHWWAERNNGGDTMEVYFRKVN